MPRFHLGFWIVFIPTMLLSSCGYMAARNIAPPESMDLDSALSQTISAVYNNIQPPGTRTVGMYLDQATVVYNVGIRSGGTDDARLQLVGAPNYIGGAFGTSVTSEGSKGNTITLTFKNVATIPSAPGKPAAPPVVVWSLFDPATMEAVKKSCLTTSASASCPQTPQEPVSPGDTTGSGQEAAPETSSQP